MVLVIRQLFGRQPWALRASYNADVMNVNRQLKAVADKRHGTNFWTHRGFWTDLAYLGRGGVHIDAVLQRTLKNYAL